MGQFGINVRVVDFLVVLWAPSCDSLELILIMEINSLLPDGIHLTAFPLHQFSHTKHEIIINIHLQLLLADI